MGPWIALLFALICARADGPGPLKWAHFDSQAALWLGSGESLRNVGLAHYVRRSPIKAPGKIRIGLFGPSIVATAEVGPGQDLPAELQSVFRESGHPEVEIVGFGAGAAAIQYSYLQWDQVGRWLDLDHVVLLLPRADPGRESTFGPYPHPHGRLVLRGNGLKKIARPSPDPAETLWPSWDTLRYDSRVPALLRKLPGRWENNPFYYHADPKTEAEELAARILTRWSQETPHFSVYVPYPLNSGLTRRLSQTGVPIFQSRLSQLGDIYWASYAHFSPLGNRLRATEIFHYLMGKDGFQPTLVSARSDTATKREAPEWPAIQGEVPVWAGTSLLGNLIPPQTWSRFPIRSWLALQPFRFVPLAQVISSDQTVWLEVTRSGNVERTEVGTLGRLHDGVAAIQWKSRQSLTQWRDRWTSDPSPRFQTPDRNANPTLVIGNLAQLPMKRGPLGWSLEHLEWRLLGRPQSPDLPAQAGLRLTARVGTTVGSVVDIELPAVTTQQSPLWMFSSRYPWPLPTTLAEVQTRAVP